MDDRDPGKHPETAAYGRSPARLLLVRCWLERDEQDRPVLRGTIADADRPPVGFHGFAQLRQRLLALVAGDPASPVE